MNEIIHFHLFLYFIVFLSTILMIECSFLLVHFISKSNVLWKLVRLLKSLKIDGLTIIEYCLNKLWAHIWNWNTCLSPLFNFSRLASRFFDFCTIWGNTAIIKIICFLLGEIENSRFNYIISFCWLVFIYDFKSLFFIVYFLQFSTK